MAKFTEDFTRMRNDCDRAHHDRERLNQEIKAEVCDMAEKVRSNLAGFADELSITREQFRKTAGQLRSELRQFADDLQGGGKIFRKRL